MRESPETFPPPVLTVMAGCCVLLEGETETGCLQAIFTLHHWKWLLLVLQLSNVSLCVCYNLLHDVCMYVCMYACLYSMYVCLCQVIIINRTSLFAPLGQFLIIHITMLLFSGFEALIEFLVVRDSAGSYLVLQRLILPAWPALGGRFSANCEAASQTWPSGPSLQDWSPFANSTFFPKESWLFVQFV